MTIVYFLLFGNRTRGCHVAFHDPRPILSEAIDYPLVAPIIILIDNKTKLYTLQLLLKTFIQYIFFIHVT